MTRILFILLFFLPATDTLACLNIFAFDSTGRVRLVEHEFFTSIEFRQETIEANLKNLKKKFDKNDYSYKNISDYGAWLLMAGRSKEGLDLFRALSNKYPDVYEIMANTAVAYELNGNIDSALVWQLAAIKANPKAHNDSEWIHLKILEARKKLASDPDWCLDHNITGIADSVRLHYKNPHHIDGKEMDMFVNAVDQLEERLSFTHAEDKVMGKFMFELGDAYQRASIHRSYYCYAMAKHLYPALGAAADKKMDEIRVKYPSRPGVGQNGRETSPPRDAAVKKFITNFISRPGIKSNKINTVSIEQLIAKI